MAEFPDYIADQIFLTKSIDGEDFPGKYKVRLFNGKSRSWDTVEVDDRIPCIDQQWFETPTPFFARNNGAELYVMLLEKAFAKVAGSYAALKGGSSLRAWLALTGCSTLMAHAITDQPYANHTPITRQFHATSLPLPRTSFLLAGRAGTIYISQPDACSNVLRSHMPTTRLTTWQPHVTHMANHMVTTWLTTGASI